VRRALALASIALCSGLAAAETADPGTGALVVTFRGERIPLPPVAMEVDLSVTGPIVRARVSQTFANPTGETIDADYVFPLPEGAAVDELALEVGDRSWTGRIEEREAATQTFERARAAGKGAALVEQHRPNIFRTRVAGIAPGDAVVVRIAFLDEADWSDGSFSTTFPMTITPRYRDDAIGSAPAMLVTLRARIDAGVPLSEIGSTSHAISVAPDATLRADLPADRDFVLRWRPRDGAEPLAGALVEERDDGRYALAMLVPPETALIEERGLPTQTVFVVDVSGSMDGPSLEQAKEALAVALDRLGRGDTFTLIKFDSGFETYSEGFLLATPRAVADAKEWVGGLSAGSGTEILPALLHALDLSSRGVPGALARVVLITDGAVGNEDEVLASARAKLGATRLHIVGIGRAPNRWLMKELAREGRGTFEAIGSIGDVREKTVALLARTERAVMTDVALEWEGGGAVEAEPDPVPDLYAGRPLVVLAKLDPSRPLPRLRVHGRTPHGPVTMDVELSRAEAGSGIGTRWARARIASLEQGRVHGADPAVVRERVIDLARRFSLVTPYTSFVVVADETEADEAEDADLPACGTREPLWLAAGIALVALGLLFARRAA